MVIGRGVGWHHIIGKQVGVCDLKRDPKTAKKSTISVKIETTSDIVHKLQNTPQIPHQGTPKNVENQIPKTVVQKLEYENKKINAAPPATLADCSKFTMSVRRQLKAPVDLVDPEPAHDDQFRPLDEGEDKDAMPADDEVANFEENSNAASGDDQLPPPSEASTRDGGSFDGHPPVSRLSSDFLDQADVVEDPLEPPEDVDEWNAVTATNCNEEVKSWIETHAATIHINKLVFDLVTWRQFLGGVCVVASNCTLLHT